MGWIGVGCEVDRLGGNAVSGRNVEGPQGAGDLMGAGKAIFWFLLGEARDDDLKGHRKVGAGGRDGVGAVERSLAMIS